jgi:hypothetical protein
MNAPDRVSVLPDPAARLVSVTVGDWPPLGSKVELAVGARRTVLNGKGNLPARVVEGIAEGARIAVHALSDPDKPRHFRCELLGDGGERLVYTYDRRFHEGEDDDEPFPPSMRWEERAARADEPLWTVRDRRVTFGDGSRLSIPGGVGALALAGEQGGNVPEDARRIRAFLEGVRWLGGAMPLPVPSQRREVVLTGRAGVLWTCRGLEPRLLELASTLVHWSDQEPERFAAVVELCRHIGAPGKLRVFISEDTSPTSEIGPQHRASVFFENVDFGLLPDAVLRRLELLVALVNPDATTLLIEEPETAAVPGMVGKLLEVLDQRAGRRQLVVATQSPHVLDWASPEEIRLVETVRGRGATVRSLEGRALEAANAHVHAGGKLSAFLAGNRI